MCTSTKIHAAEGPVNTAAAAQRNIGRHVCNAVWLVPVTLVPTDPLIMVDLRERLPGDSYVLTATFPPSCAVPAAGEKVCIRIKTDVGTEYLHIHLQHEA